MRRLLLILALPLIMLGQDKAPYRKAYSQGPLGLLLELDRTAAGLDDRIALSLTASAPEEYTVSLPDLDKGDALKYFIVSADEKQDKVEHRDGLVTRRRTYILEPVCVREKFKIGQIGVRFTKDNEAAHEICTEEIPLDITIPPDEEIQKRLDGELKSSSKPMTRLHPPSIWPYVIWTAIAAAAIAILYAALAFIIRKRREKAAIPPPPLPPWINARRELERLLAERLSENGLFMEYYNRIQLILRTYIEDRFQIRAPELTTEEFLDKLRKEDSAVASYREQLEQFLRHCDLVRFAAQIPSQQDIAATFKSCSDFVEATTPAPEMPQESKEAHL